MRAASLKRGAIALIVLALAAGCAAPQTRRVIDAPPGDLPARVELRSVVFHAQARYQCGPAALATVLADAGVTVAPDTLVDAVYIPERQGSLRTEMRAAARARGRIPYPLAPRMDDLLREIAAGNPVLVMQNLGLAWWPRWHYAVVVGYDLQQRALILRSGTTRRRVTGFANFERTWARTEYWAQIVVRPARPPATAGPDAWLRAVHEFERTAGPEAARAGYAAANRRWPGHVPGWMAHGNAAYATGEPGAARRFFTRAVSLAPNDWQGWNNLAYALAATGEGGALAAARCARALAPESGQVRATLDELEARGLEPGARPADLPACPAP